jgi:SAM-dependent methyltransferase
MDPLLLCGCNFWFSTQARNPVSVGLIVERDQGSFTHIGVERMFEPWSAWFDIRFLQTVGDDTRSIEVISGLDCILASANPRPWLDAALSKAEATGVRVIRPHYAAVGTWTNDATREVAHFDFEIGGLNQWDNAALKYAETTLRLRSLSHCVHFFPFWALRDTLELPRLTAVDLGSGPLSHLRWGHLNRLLQVRLVDPLLPVYQLVLARHSAEQLDLSLLAEGIPCLGEELSAHIPESSVDLVYTANALDHTQDPLRVINEIERILRPGGTLAVSVATREGTRQNWDQFHKTDIYLNAFGMPVFRRQTGSELPLLGKLQLKKIVTYHDSWLSFTAVKAGSE